MKTLFAAIIIGALIIAGGNYGINKYRDGSEIAIYRNLHTPTPGTYYQVSDIGSPTQDGGKQFLIVTELVTTVTSNPKTGDTVVELKPGGKVRQIEVPTPFSGPKSLGSIVTVENRLTRYFVSSHEAVKNLLGIRNEKP